MNLEKLFQTQKVLRDRIGYNEPDRFNKLILALLVELGECANEWRGFKFWSQNQQPTIKQARAPYMDLDDAEFYNPLLEEYVDGLHFVLELGLDLDIYYYLKLLTFTTVGEERSVTSLFNSIFESVTTLLTHHNDGSITTGYTYEVLVDEYLTLGAMLGFTWEEVEQAYFAKNQINHQRQEVGY